MASLSLYINAVGPRRAVNAGLRTFLITTGSGVSASAASVSLEPGIVAMMPSIFDNMSEYVRNKCNEVLDQLNERLKRPYKIAFSMGIFECRANEYKSISEIIDKADYLLYVQKRERKKLLDS